MQVRIIGSSPDSPRTRQHASSYLINGTVAIDAGCIGFWGTSGQQSAVRQILFTHAHMDHIASLPIFLENAFDADVPPVTLHASNDTMEVLRDHVFNNRVWPDFLNMRIAGRPFAQTAALHPGQALELEGLRILPVAVHHLVPTLGFIVTDGRSTVVFGGDSGPTTAIWEEARAFPEPRTVILEASFPNRLTRLAELSLHMTPAMAGAECAKFPPVRDILIVHVKPRFREEMEAELMALGVESLRIADCDGVYSV
jgi:ribonuclease BN (tRNA processing enzyme)